MLIENQLNTIKKQLQHYLNSNFKELNIKSSEMIFLRVLDKVGKTSQTELAKRLECDKSHIHRITNKLLGKDLIRFIDNSIAKTRNNILEISEKGKFVINKVNNSIKIWTEKIVNGISEEELNIFHSVIEKISINATKINIEGEL